MKLTGTKMALSGALLAALITLSACGGGDGDNTAAASSSSSSSSAVSSSSATSSSQQSSAASSAAGPWASALTGDVLEVKLADLKPTQGGLGFDQIYYKLGRYELAPAKKFDDFCADEGLTGVASSTTASLLSDATSFTCTVTDTSKRDTSVLGTVVVGPGGNSLYLTDGHHGLSTYYEVADGGPNLKVHVLVRNNLSAYSGSAFWAQMSSNNYVWLKNGSDTTITPAQLPTALGLKNGLENDVYRSLVYFTRDVGYSKPAAATDFLEFYWAEWLRAQSGYSLASYDFSKLNTTTAPATDTGALGAVWNASLLMVAAADPIIAGKTGTDLGKLTSINAGKAYSSGTFGDLSKLITASKPGKIAYMLYYKSAHGL